MEIWGLVTESILKTKEKPTADLGVEDVTPPSCPQLSCPQLQEDELCPAQK